MSLSLAEFEGLLKTTAIGRAPGWKNELWDSIDSTNARALTLASEGAPHGVVVAARQQSAGRGRLGRTWVSPADTGLYISFVVRVNLPQTALPLVSLAAGTAAAEAIEITCGIRPGLKWVNDIVYGGKKIGGILCEMQSPPALVVGIGINVRLNPEQMPADISQTANSLENLTGSPISMNVLAAELSFRLEKALSVLCQDQGRAQTVQNWKRYSATLGQNIIATCANQKTCGLAVDLAADGGLIIEKENGEREVLRAGEVSIRNANGSYY